MSDDQIERAKATLEKIQAQCEKQIGLVGERADVFLHIRGTWGSRTHARLYGRAGGPQGRIVEDVMRPGMIGCLFPAREVLADVRKKLTELEAEGGRE